MIVVVMSVDGERTSGELDSIHGRTQDAVENWFLARYTAAIIVTGRRGIRCEGAAQSMNSRVAASPLSNVGDT